MYGDKLVDDRDMKMLKDFQLSVAKANFEVCTNFYYYYFFKLLLLLFLLLLLLLLLGY